MGASENLELVRRGYAAFSTGDMETLSGLFKPDVVHSVPGTSPIAGDHKGPDEVLAMYGNLFSLSEGTMSVELEDVLSDGGNQVVSIHPRSGSSASESFGHEGDAIVGLHDRDPHEAGTGGSVELAR